MGDPRLRELRHKLGRDEKQLKGLLERHSGDTDAAVAEWEADHARIQDEADRPRWIRRVPPTTRYEADEKGEVRPPTASDIERGRKEGSYTHSPRSALMDAGEAIPEDVQNELTKEAHRRGSVLRAEQLRDQDARSTVNQVREAQRRGKRRNRDLRPLNEAIRKVVAEWEQQEAA